MNLLRYTNLDLPIYPEDQVAFTTSEIRAAAQSGADSFVRRACLRYNGPLRDLQAVLDIGDRVLSTVCDVMYIDKVDYQWGLVPLSQASRKRMRAHVDIDTYDCSVSAYGGSVDDSLIPDGYGLVASVGTIADAGRLGYFDEQKIEGYGPSGIGIESDNFSVTNEDLSRTDQFVVDPVKRANGLGGIMLIDIEPRLKLTAVK